MGIDLTFPDISAEELEKFEMEVQEDFNPITKEEWEL